MVFISQRCHALTCCQYMVVLCILLSSSLWMITTDAMPHDLPYALGFYFLNTSLPAGTCQTELDLVTNASYPVYEKELTIDSTLTASDLEILAASSSTTTTVAGAPLTRRRNNEKRRQLRQRQLQQFCYTYCNSMPQAWLIAHGCKDECSRRRLEQEQRDDAVAERKEDNDHRNAMATLSSILTSNYYTKDGSADKIMNGQGDEAAKEFYDKASLLINASNPCRELILTMTYARVPMLVNV